MNDPKRVPTVESLLSQLRGLDLNVRNVVDVGVLSGTGFLMEYFPKAKHYLFEPVDRFFDVIRAGYQSLDFDLHHLGWYLRRPGRRFRSVFRPMVRIG